MPRHKRPARRVTVFRCPEDVLQRMDACARLLGGDRSSFMVAAVLNMVGKLAEEGVVPPLPPLPEPEEDMQEFLSHYNADYPD